MCNNLTKKALAVIIILSSAWTMLGNGSSHSILQDFASMANKVATDAARIVAVEEQSETIRSNETSLQATSLSNATMTLQATHSTIQVSTGLTANSKNNGGSTIKVLEQAATEATSTPLKNRSNIDKESTTSMTQAAQPLIGTTPLASTNNNTLIASQSIPKISPAAPPAPIVQPTRREKRLANLRFKEITKAWSNVTTTTYFQGHFYAGYRNQIMAFTALVMEAALQKHGQILLTGLRHKDTFGSNKKMPHEFLFDVEHWNSHYPALPRLVTWDPALHDQLNCRGFNPHWTIENPELNATRPFAYGRQSRLLGQYKRYSKGKGTLAKKFRNPVELLMLRGAMRPHPDLRAIADRLIASKVGEGKEYMTLHARVEPDMQAHNVCYYLKEKNLTKIFLDLENQFPEPPAPMVFMPINRQYMEQEGSGPNEKDPENTNWLAIENLAALNHAVSHGLWNGTVKVFEFGAKALNGTSYGSRWSTSGAILNFYIAIGGNVFVGTEVSSYSIDLLSTRFYRGNRRNYKYLPDGLHEWTPEGTKHSPGFAC